MLVPLLPLTFIAGYQADLAWGNKMERVLGKCPKQVIDSPSLPPYLLIATTDEMLANEKGILRLPGVPLTVELLDTERAKSKSK